MEATSYEFIVIRPLPQEPKRKTRVYNILSKRGDALGSIRWYGPWRQYCLMPHKLTVWSAGCLVDVQDFLGKLKAERAPK